MKDAPLINYKGKQTHNKSSVALFIIINLPVLLLCLCTDTFGIRWKTIPTMILICDTGVKVCRMPARRPVETLESTCFVVLAQSLHHLAIELEETKDECSTRTEELSQQINSLPGVIIEQLVTKVIEIIQQSFSRTRRPVGLRTCLVVLLQPAIQRLDLSGLFFRMRLPGSINGGIREVVSSQISGMKNLTSLNLVSKCSDDILAIICKHCPDLTDLNVSISDLVTDQGMKSVAIGCTKLETLGIYKCWEVTSEGIVCVLRKARNLSKMKCDQLGAVIISTFRKSATTFKLKHFEQTHTLFEPLEEDMAWVGRACPDIESVSLFVDDEGLGMIPQLGKVKVLEVETSAVLGTGFVNAVTCLGSSLQTLQLNCNQMSHESLVLLGESCPQLGTLHISTAVVEGDKYLLNPGHLFSALTTLHLQVWKESEISRECVEFFLLWCQKLESVLIKADLKFLSDQFLARLLATNPLTHAKLIYITSDSHVPLTVASVHRLLGSCPGLESLAVSSWDVTEEEYFSLRSSISASNYNLTIT
ncbi:hypothetical protein Pmani_030997 [Petrolisthes manimaculis]|uniref:F-box/LRR-repeat protein 2 n=1 Tax=Petrolisthes manimaculis TaxID=1843537 RepID=A0AAE1TSX8_9EUCA|nr:hypothetical protein Pmani_030997 [Petrolisthes manimaculis]